ncbi:SRPBCC family protein [Geodermatophilus sp. CPCC 206100]|uniref:SRPBCC family protein n=1 Tax=Geodermatophilus sp. CPCC 206100 TaxID=3020054 RepID=UPI003AFFD238
MTQQDVHARRGVVTTEADGRQLLEFRRSWPDPIDDVWSAVTEPERLARWIGRYEGERGPGGQGLFFMTHEGDDEPAGSPATIVECAPPQRLVVDTAGPGETWRLELDLTEEAGRTVLVFRQRFAPEADVADVAGGWHWYLDRLEAEVTGGEGPGDWEPFWAEVGPGYGRDVTG